MCLSGLRRLDAEDEQSWVWTRPDGEQGDNYRRFREHVRRVYGYERRPLQCCFIFQVIPRVFFERYATAAGKNIGMLEYKIPTYAEIFGVPFYTKDFGINVAMNAIPREIPDDFIREELAKPDGWRLFHPHYRVWDLSRAARDRRRRRGPHEKWHQWLGRGLLALCGHRRPPPPLASSGVVTSETELTPNFCS
jgi:hypothetical protein